MVSIVSAMTIAITVYGETSSFLLAFVAYSITGTLVLTSVLVSAFFELRAEDQSES